MPSRRVGAHAHRRERLVDLPQVDVADGEAGPAERLGDRLDRRQARARRRHARPTPRPARRRAARGPRPRPPPRSARTSAAPPSLTPDALPAVMLKPGISGWMGLSEASFSRLLVRRGCSSTAKVVVVPSRRVTSSGTTSSSKLPLSMAATARWCERNAQASISSRVTPASTAAFHPTVIDMSSLGASGVFAVARRRPVGPVVGARHPAGPARRGRRRLDAAGHHHAVHAGPDRGRGGRHGGQARGAVAVVGDARHVLEAGLDRHVAGDVAAAVAGLAEDHVVDERGVDRGAAHGLGHDVGAERRTRRRRQRALEGRADGGPCRRHDHRVTHCLSPCQPLPPGRAETNPCVTPLSSDRSLSTTPARAPA